MKKQKEFIFNFKPIAEYIKINNLTIKQFCQSINIGKSTYYTMKRGSLNFDSMVALKLVRILGFNFDELIIRCQ